MSHSKKNLLFGSLSAGLVGLGAFAIVELTNARPSVAASAPGVTTAHLAAGSHVDGNHFTLDGTAADCAVGGSCFVTIKLAAQGEYHINQQYPYKFTASPAAGVSFLGADSANPNVFTKTAGDFAINDEKNATMSVKFKVGQKGAVSIAGTYKLSVCSAQNCQLEQQDLAIGVTAK
jgi:hypothetical protein